MPRFITPKKFIRIFSAHLSNAENENDFRSKLETVERMAETAIQANMKEGFFSSPMAMMDQKGNLIFIVATIGQQRVPGEVEQAAEAGPPAVPVLLPPRE